MLGSRNFNRPSHVATNPDHGSSLPGRTNDIEELGVGWLLAWLRKKIFQLSNGRHSE